MSEPTVTFVTGSSVVWGAEISMLSIAKGISMPKRLLASNRDLVDRWVAENGPTATLVPANQGRLGRNRAFLSALLREAKVTDVLVIFDFYLMPSVAVLRPILRAHNVRLVIDVHDAVDRNPRRKPYFWLFRFADLAIAISDYVAAQLPKGVARERIYRPVEAPSGGSHVASPSHTPSIGIVGQLSPDKRVAEGLRAISECDLDAKVILRGSADADTEYATRVITLAESAFGTNFRHEGRVPRDQVMSGLDILLVPNSGEPFGRVAAEAQLSGTLVVGPRSGGIAEIIEDGVTGFSFDPLSDTSMRDAIRRSINERISPTGVAESAMLSARERFDPQKQSTRYELAIRGVARR